MIRSRISNLHVVSRDKFSAVFLAESLPQTPIDHRCSRGQDLFTQRRLASAKSNGIHCGSEWHIILHSLSPDRTRFCGNTQPPSPAVQCRSERNLYPRHGTDRTTRCALCGSARGRFSPICRSTFCHTRSCAEGSRGRRCRKEVSPTSTFKNDPDLCFARSRHRMGLDQEGRGLFQYVIEDEDSSASQAKKPERRVIQLDDVPVAKERKYTPPQRIAIYLSKIELPELQPKTTASNPPSTTNGSAIGSQSRNGHSSASQPVAPIPRRGSKPQGNTLPASGLAPPLPEKRKSSPDPVARPDSTQVDDKPSRISRLFRTKS